MTHPIWWKSAGGRVKINGINNARKYKQVKYNAIDGQPKKVWSMFKNNCTKLAPLENVYWNNKRTHKFCKKLLLPFAPWVNSSKVTQHINTIDGPTDLRMCFTTLTYVLVCYYNDCDYNCAPWVTLSTVINLFCVLCCVLCCVLLRWLRCLVGWLVGWLVCVLGVRGYFCFEKRPRNLRYTNRRNKGLISVDRRTSLLSYLQYPVPYQSRLQRIYRSQCPKGDWIWCWAEAYRYAWTQRAVDIVAFQHRFWLRGVQSLSCRW